MVKKIILTIVISLGILPSLADPIQKNVQMFNLTFQKGDAEFFPGKKTATWGVSTSFLFSHRFTQIFTDL
jgi:hypothetical protein